jgi:hypothetical protein
MRYPASGEGIPVARGERQAPDAAKGIGNHLGLERPLPLVGDVRVLAAAAAPVLGATPVRRWHEHVDRVGVRHRPGHALDPRGHAFAGDGPRDEHDLPSCRPSIRPPATGRSTSTVIVSPDFSTES